MYTIRNVQADDADKILSLYQAVGAAAIGIARSPEEISATYIRNFMQLAGGSGIERVIENPGKPGEIVAEIHCHTPAPKIFSHILTDLTIAIHPDFQGKGLGKQIFTHLLDLVTASRPDILRVELFVQESNERAIALYKKIGFIPEGRFEKRVHARHGGIEADIPMAWFNPAYLHHPIK